MPSGRLLTTVHRRLLMDGLRRELGKLDGDCNLTFENIELLRPKYKHTIQLVEGWPEEFEEQPPFTCVMHALGLSNDPLHTAVRCIPRMRESSELNPKGEIFADTNFVEFCIERVGLQLISDHKKSPGDSIIYRNENGKCKHIGEVIENGRIRSKWGAQLFCEHKPKEVLDYYGNEIQYVERLEQKRSTVLFAEYAQQEVFTKNLPVLMAFIKKYSRLTWSVTAFLYSGHSGHAKIKKLKGRKRPEAVTERDLSVFACF